MGHALSLNDTSCAKVCQWICKERTANVKEMEKLDGLRASSQPAEGQGYQFNRKVDPPAAHCDPLVS